MEKQLAAQVCHFVTWLRFAGIGFVWRRTGVFGSPFGLPEEVYEAIFG
jgi:hypothetical protein